MILIDSVYINESGGKILLELLLDKLTNTNSENLFLLLDERCENKLELKNIPSKNIRFLAPSYKARLHFYKSHKNDFSKVFCFANVPPPIRMKCKVITYFHSFMLDLPIGTSLKNKLILTIKKNIIKVLKKNTDYWFVQSSNMKDLVSRKLGVSMDDIILYPFFKELKTDTSVKRNQGSFIFMSNGYEHKNHSRLLDAWDSLYDDGFNLPLTLTIKERFTSLLERVEKLRNKGLLIENIGWVDDVSKELSKYQFQIYPSLTESFGLGLVEAVACGCEVIAPNLDYVNAAIVPLMYFDPFAAESIKKAAIKAKDIPLSEKMVSSIQIKNDLDGLVFEILN